MVLRIAMETLWFMIVAVMVAAYAVLDGFDLGAGAIYLGAGRTSDDRRKILRAIGPVWDGNEVWLVAAGGTLYFAFPLLYASSFSGFYLPLMMVLWLLMLRGIGIELRAHMENPVWLGFFDLIFCASSILLAIFFGAALGNVVRGVPLGADGYFFEPLWTNFRVGANTGILDWYTILTGVIALVTLTAHGSLYIAVKTENETEPARARGCAVGLAVAVHLNHRGSDRNLLRASHGSRQLQTACHRIFDSRRGLWQSRCNGPRHPQRPGQTCLRRLRSLHHWMLVGAAFALYPVVLPASTNPAYNLTIYNTAAARHGLNVGITWWIIAMVLALDISLSCSACSGGR